MNDDPIKRSNGADEPDSLVTPPAGTGEQEDDAEFLRYARMVLERKWLVLSCVFLFVAAATFQLRKAVPIYITSATVKYEPTSLRVVDFGEVGRPVNAVDEIRTQVEVIRGPEITKAVIEALGLHEGLERASAEQVKRSLTPLEYVQQQTHRLRVRAREILVPPRKFDMPHDQLRYQGLIAGLRGKVTVRQREDTKLIDIIVRDSNPNMAARIANEFADQYRNSLRVNRADSYEDVQEFFQNQVGTTRQQLEKAKQALLEYSEQANTDLRMMEQEAEIALNMTKSLREQIENLRNEVALYDVALAEEDSDAVRAHLLAQDRDYTTLVNRINELKLREVTLDAVNMPDNPELKSLQLQIQTLAEQRAEHERRFRLESVGQALLSKRNLAALERRLKEQEAKFNDLQGMMIEYSALKMDVETHQQMFEQLLSRFKEISIASRVEPDNVAIHARAEIPTVPSEPRVFNSLMMHAIIGFLMGCALAVGIGWLDRTVHDPAQAQAATGLSPVGVIPYMGGKFRVPFLRGRNKRGSVKLISSFDPYSQQAESFRLLRTNLQYSTAGRSPATIMVTSCMPSEGKSTVSANLAISFASLGERTLLIDADLKLPNMHRQFGISRRPGLSDVLTGQETAESVIVRTEFENLDIMPAGPQSPSPVELLESAVMARLLEQLRPTYSRIILDTAPLHGMSDSFVLGKKVDGICLVASIGRTRVDVLKRTVQSLQSLRVRVLGLVFNHQYGSSRAMPLYYHYKGGAYSTSGYTDSQRGRYDRLARRESDEVALSKKS